MLGEGLGLWLTKQIKKLRSNETKELRRENTFKVWLTTAFNITIFPVEKSIVMILFSNNISLVSYVID